MFLRRVAARDFLTFKNLDLRIGSGLTVVTGPNGVGKSNFGRCLDLALAAIGHGIAVEFDERLSVYTEAVRDGASSFEVILDLTLDQDWERELLVTYICAAFACGRVPAPHERHQADFDLAIRKALLPQSLVPLFSGSLYIRYDPERHQPWSSTWEFKDSGNTWNLCLEGLFTDQLRFGSASSTHLSADYTATVPRDRLNQWMLSVASDEEPKPPEGSVPDTLDFRDLLPLNDKSSISMHLHMHTDTAKPIPVSLTELVALVGADMASRPSFGSRQILWEIIRRGIVVTDNRRLPIKRKFLNADFDRPIDLRNGQNVAAELFRLKNGATAQRCRYIQIEETFAFLTGGKLLGLQARPLPTHTDPGALAIEPTVLEGGTERSIELSGAGVQEALVLSAIISPEPGRVIVLDEPGVNLEPTVQRRLMSTLRGEAQCILITHSADLVPSGSEEDLHRIVRLVRSDIEGTKARRAPLLDKDTARRWLALLEPAHVRGLLFASAVVLCEGSTDIGALSKWWRDTSAAGFPDPIAANIAVVGVGGQNGYGIYIEYLDAFGVPWAIVADGPALRGNSGLAKHLAKNQHLPPGPPPSNADTFDNWAAYWEPAGVFTLADQFGASSHGGELEKYLQRLNPELFAAAQEISGRSKPRAGAWFALMHKPVPAEVIDLYKKIMRHFAKPRDTATAALDFEPIAMDAQQQPGT